MINPFTLLNPGTWLATILVGLALYLGAQWWGHTKYEAGREAMRGEYAIAAEKARAKNEQISKEIEREIGTAVRKSKEFEQEREVLYAKREARVAALDRDARELRAYIASGSATPIDPNDACGTHRRRAREAEALLGESGEVLAACGGLVVEGEAIAKRLADEHTLARDFIAAARRATER
jgi:hypothetical protein